MRRKFGNITWYNVEIAYLTKPICLHVSSPTISGGLTISNVRCIIAMLPNKRKENNISFHLNHYPPIIIPLFCRLITCSFLVQTHFNSERVKPIIWPTLSKEIWNKTMQFKWFQAIDHYELKYFGAWLTISAWHVKRKIKLEVKLYHVWAMRSTLHLYFVQVLLLPKRSRWDTT